MKLIPTRLRFYRPVRWGLPVVIALAWLALPPTGKPFKRLYRAGTVNGPRCAVCYRPAAGEVGYGSSGGYKVSYCSYHLAGAPNTVTLGSLDSNGAMTFLWGLVSFLLFVGIAGASSFPDLAFRFRKDTFNDAEPFVQVFDRQTGTSLVQIDSSSSPYTVRGDPNAIAYLDRKPRPASMSLADYIIERARRR